MQRYFVKEKNEKIEFLKNDINHIKKVMRMKVNDKIEVAFNEKVFLAKIIDIENVEVEIIEELETVDFDVKITIAQALVREQKWDLILQKTTELGVYSIIPLKLERCNVVIDDKKLDKKMDRWNNICKEASEQSYRHFIPFITDITDLKQLVNTNYDLKLFCSTTESLNTLKNVLQNTKKYDNILIVIGPEGGLSQKEEQLMLNNDFIPVSLGKSILRTETAPLFVLSAINYENWS